MLSANLYAGNIELEDVGIAPTFVFSTWTWTTGKIRVSTPTVDLDAANKWYVDNDTHAGGGAGYVLRTGDTMTGDLSMTNGAHMDLNWQDFLNIGIAIYGWGLTIVSWPWIILGFLGSIVLGGIAGQLGKV